MLVNRNIRDTVSAPVHSSIKHQRRQHVSTSNPVWVFAVVVAVTVVGLMNHVRDTNNASNIAESNLILPFSTTTEGTTRLMTTRETETTSTGLREKAKIDPLFEDNMNVAKAASAQLSKPDMQAQKNLLEAKLKEINEQIVRLERQEKNVESSHEKNAESSPEQEVQADKSKVAKGPYTAVDERNGDKKEEKQEVTSHHTKQDNNMNVIEQQKEAMRDEGISTNGEKVLDSQRMAVEGQVATKVENVNTTSRKDGKAAIQEEKQNTASQHAKQGDKVNYLAHQEAATREEGITTKAEKVIDSHSTPVVGGKDDTKAEAVDTTSSNDGKASLEDKAKAKSDDPITTGSGKKKASNNTHGVEQRVPASGQSTLADTGEVKNKQNNKSGASGSTKQSATTPKNSVEELNQRPIHFMRWGEFGHKDSFSASWLQSSEDFLAMNLDKVNICEDAAFKAFQGRNKRVLMTLDWLDFSLEHLSKWWKMLQIYHHQSVFDTAIKRFDDYLAKSTDFPIDPSFQQTIAVIAFQAYKDNRKEHAYNLTLMSLGATIESLRRAGMGRVVVVGSPKSLDMLEMDRKIAEDTFRHLKQKVEGMKVSNSTVTMVGNMEVGYTEFEANHSITKNVKKNVPRATLVALRDALLHSKNSKKQLSDGQVEKVHELLGERHSPAYWKYVYLTEPDSILQTRPATLKQLKEEVDQGMIIVPHRLQPIPHEDDAPGHPRDHLYLPKTFKPVIELDAIGEHDACCDAHQGPDYGPGKDEFPSCGNFWYMCGFNWRLSKENRTHDRLKPYSLIKLKRGTEIVSLSALEHGRMCIPRKNDVCVPPAEDKNNNKASQ